VQLFEFSQQSVSADSKEIGAALFLLLIFALVAAWHVFKKGIEKGDRTTHELLLKCVIIITSVVPRQLPVQMAMAVNTALMALTKAGVFCTEPYRVPLVGKVTHCLFDKTGTITTDTLVPASVVNQVTRHFSYSMQDCVAVGGVLIALPLLYHRCMGPGSDEDRRRQHRDDQRPQSGAGAERLQGCGVGRRCGLCFSITFYSPY
jgi:cation-transporting ATPase 13A1